MRVLLLCSAFNGLSQRLHRELAQMRCELTVQLATDEASIERAVGEFCPDLIICPFLKHRVPESVWRRIPCLIVHPGIEGDRGPSSLDWAIQNGLQEWGVTLLQANEEMDAGDIWGTRTFKIRPGASKSSLYRREVSDDAVELVKYAIAAKGDPLFSPRPLVPASAPGRLLPGMTQADRQIDWENDSTEVVLRKMRAADSLPGIRETISGKTVYLFGAVEEHTWRGSPGQFFLQADRRLCRATADGAVWISHAKLQDGFKLPAGDVILPLLDYPVDTVDTTPEYIRDIRVEIINRVGYLYFSFHGGAMSTRQCQELLSAYRQLQDSDIDVICLMGGEEFWSNGIHLNIIEAAEDPAEESWANINAIDDLVESIITTEGKLTVAALRSNAGAGGAMMALACDVVAIRRGVVINPHYKTMGLFGSEYWTYLLPARVGARKAREYTENCLPVLAEEALSDGYADYLLSEDREVYRRELIALCEELRVEGGFTRKLAMKSARRAQDEQNRPLSEYRKDELQKMQQIFFDPGAEYHRARKAFVYKQCAKCTPAYLQKKVTSTTIPHEESADLTVLAEELLPA
ncbi:enoyl-CoA hydratase-related protein [Microbulbifer pacificus]|uniref:enoyl-CoA hydratase-related protein n=1 Tax=Microbulbifer pacificus TaxID=407164 RepID=UPI000CF373D7|nr:enoyl-CoA hydratase-related protein [Microbulbifer pacificus]